MKAQTAVIPETTQKEMEEILKIIKKSDYDVVEQLGQTVTPQIYSSVK